MKTEKALKYLKGIVGESPMPHVICPIKTEVLVTAIKALEKQIHKKPLKNKYWTICPNCNRSEYIENKPLYTHCAFCGQAIDWEEE